MSDDDTDTCPVANDAAAAAAVPRRHKRRKKSPARIRRIACKNYDGMDDDDDVGWRHCNALDTELEQQVNELMIQSSNEKNERNKYKRLAITAIPDTNSNNNIHIMSCTEGEEIGYKKSANDNMSKALPVLLYIREIGLSSQSGRHNSKSRIPFTKNVDFIAANGKHASWMTLLLHQPAHSQRNEKRNEKNNCHHNGSNKAVVYDSDSDHSNTIGRLRVPIQNRRNALSFTRYDPDDHYLSKSIGCSCSLFRLTKWRPYTRQTIRFSKLQTPHSVAILSIDQWGGFSIGVDKDGRDRGVASVRRPTLSLKFYGLPSPARLLSSGLSSKSLSALITSPLIHSIPLLLNNHNNNNNSDNLGSTGDSQISDTPIQILLCSNGAFGVGYILDAKAIAPHRSDIFSKSPSLQEDVTGTIVIFETPRNGTSAMTTSFHCCNIRIGGWKSFTMRNALWPTNYVPVAPHYSLKEFSSLLFDTNVPSAHVLVNDEEDGFRLTWINPFKEEGGLSDAYAATATYIPLPSHQIQATRNDIVTVTDVYETWEACFSDSSTGLIAQNVKYTVGTPNSSNKSLCTPRLNIAYEVYLHIDALLLDIITRRHQSSSMFRKSPYQSDNVRFIPNFYYNLISVSDDGLNVTVVIVFSNKEKMMMQLSSKKISSSSSNDKKLPAALGVVINLGIFTQSFDELKWFQHPSCADDSSMKQWCNLLALNYRMKDCGVGLFCLERSMVMDTWVGKTHERNTDEDLDDDINVDLWSNYYVEREEAKASGRRKPTTSSAVPPPKDISMSSLYPHCDVITNEAVYDATPVKRISCRKSPIDLIYG